MTRPVIIVRPLPLQAPTAFVRIRPRGRVICGEPRTTTRLCAASRRFPRK